ncbi:MAG: FliH/SctL family protein [Rhodoferax sp.]|nr:FliH/SctL family protein [Rhodoferax sp.]
MSKDGASSAKADARKAEVRPARVWQPTDLSHPIAPESGFVASAWRTQQEPVFGLTDFDTPTVDLLPPAQTPAPEEPTVAAEAVAPAPPAVVETPVAAAQALAQAREEGRAQGAAEARAALQSEMEEKLRVALGDDHALVNALTDALALLQQSPQTFFEPLKRLALHLAEQLVLAELALDGGAIERLVQRCVDELAQHDESLVLVELHPGDLSMLQEIRARSGLTEGSALRLQANEQLLPGSVRASANDALVEDLIGERLSALARGLAVDEPRWRSQTAFSAERIASDRIPGTGVEDARPRMASSANAASTPIDSGFDTVAAIDEILRDAEDHV